MQTVALSPILTLLAWSVVLLLVQMIMQAMTGILEHGLPYALSAQDEERDVEGLYAARIGRAFYNLLETYPVFIALALALAITGKTGGAGLLGAQIWFWARVIYVPVYIAGIPGLRTLVWAASVVGLIMMLIGLLS
jgi:uncharacterized MAPEG superfamily protein